MKKVSKTTQAFFDYSYNGDGKYYTTSHSGRNYTNTLFQTFRNKNADCIEVLEYGNDAPRGGKTGDFLYRDWETDRKSTRLNSSHRSLSRMPSSA